MGSGLVHRDKVAVFSQDRAALASLLKYRMDLNALSWKLRKSLGPQSFSPAATLSLEKIDFLFYSGN